MDVGTMLKLIKAFAQCENGAVTVDWVVLTAGVVGLSVGLVLMLNDSTSNVASNISDYVADVEVGK